MQLACHNSSRFVTGCGTLIHTRAAEPKRQPDPSPGAERGTASRRTENSHGRENRPVSGIGQLDDFSSPSGPRHGDAELLAGTGGWTRTWRAGPRRAGCCHDRHADAPQPAREHRADAGNLEILLAERAEALDRMMYSNTLRCTSCAGAARRMSTPPKEARVPHPRRPPRGHRTPAVAPVGRAGAPPTWTDALDQGRLDKLVEQAGHHGQLHVVIRVRELDSHRQPNSGTDADEALDARRSALLRPARPLPRRHQDALERLTADTQRRHAHGRLPPQANARRQTCLLEVPDENPGRP